MTVRSRRIAPTGIRFAPYGKEALRERRGIEQIQNHKVMKFNIQNYKDLKGKTIFDFTEDEKIIKEIVGFNSFDKERKEHYINNCHPINAARDIYEYACIMKEKGLRQAALLYSDEAQEEMEERAEEAAKEGIIID
ncbi:hypothetical protein [Bacteroides nordii]|uniref:hypothetical protein n=1 Tax=Bacteroides nordii TaxID=291645 RepID=UPI0034A2C931